MKAPLLSLDGKEIKKIDLPIQFSEEIRPDLVKRAVLALQSNNRQAYGTKPEAGKRASAKLSKRRRDYRGSYGYGISRVPRKILTRRGRRFYWVAAFAPGTVGGRKAHPPKSEKIWKQKINKKERRKAIRSAISAAVVAELVKKRNHVLPKVYPIIIENKFEELDKTSKVKKVLEKIDLKEELERVNKKKVRAGKGKSRGRTYKKKKGPLIVVSKECELQKSAKSIPGVDVCLVKNLNADLLAPGADIGRLTIWTEGAIERLSKEKLFV